MLGSITSMREIKSDACSETKGWIEYVPATIFLYSFYRSSSSKGKKPQIKAKRITPIDQTLTAGPSYFFYENLSGDAYDGEPHAVFNL